MKYAIATLLLLLSLSTQAKSLRDSLIISPRISFADYSNKNQWDNYSINKIPPIAFQVERFYNDYFSYGVLLGFYRNKYTNDTLSSNFHRDFNIGFGGLASLHYSTLIEDLTDNRIRFGDFDLYLTLVAHWVVTNSTIRENYHLQNDMPEKLDETTVDFTLGPVAGLRYYISDKFAMNFEFGSGNLGLVTMGVSWNLSRDKKIRPKYVPEKVVPGDIN